MRIVATFPFVTFVSFCLILIKRDRLYTRSLVFPLPKMTFTIL